jgi:hypothetical protein
VPTASATITSPGYPSNYPLNIECSWIITAGKELPVLALSHSSLGIKQKCSILGIGQIITLTFIDFQVEYAGDYDCNSCDYCPYDYVAIYDGPTSSAPVLR